MERSAPDPDARSTPAAGVSRRRRLATELPGLALCVVVAGAAWLLARRIDGLSTAAASIGLGILAGNLLPGRTRLAPGTRRASHGVLGAAIALMGLTIPFTHLPALPALAALVGVMVLTLISSGLLGRALGLGGRSGLLGGMGTAVCGSAAIAASAPVLGSEAVAVAAALASVNLLSAVGMVVLPVLAHALGTGATEAGWWAGGSLQALGQAVGAGFAVSEVAGQTATTVKLFRVATLVLWLPLLGLGAGRRGRRAGLPWFVPGFLLTAALASLVRPPDLAAPTVHLLLAVALAGIGAGIRPRELVHQGPRMLLLCSAAMLVQFAGVVLLVAAGLAG